MIMDNDAAQGRFFYLVEAIFGFFFVFKDDMIINW